MSIGSFLLAAAAALAATQAADSLALSAGQGLTYADLADLGAAAPVAAHLRLRRAQALREREAPNVLPGHTRFLVEADVVALIRGAGGIAPQVTYLVDLPNDSRGRRAPLRRRSEVLVLAHRVPGRAGELRLVAPDAQLAYTPETAGALRALLRDSTGPSAAPGITGVGAAFHVPGSLPGESETQIFLQTANERPVSLNVLRRPGERPRWSVALSEVVDDSAGPPAPGTFLWYRLACTLPPRLPAASLREAAPGDARAIADDYRLVMEGLGPCLRNRVRR